MSLSKEEQSRYQRHLILPGFGESAQEKLKAASILVIGAGGLGCPALLYLAASGFGRIGIIDDDIVSESNLHRQILFSSEDIGQYKATVAKDKLRKTNPFIQIDTFTENLGIHNAISILKNYDMVMDGTDNFTTRYLVNDACIILNKPLISGSIFTFEGQVSVFNYQDGPTYRCLFPEAPSAEEMPNCAEIGVLGVLPGVVGTIMATEAIKIATGIGEVLSGKLLVYNALTMDFHRLDFQSVAENKLITSLTEKNINCSVTSELTSFQLKQKLALDENLHLIDVREEDEHAIFNIGGENLPLSKLKSLAHRIPKDRIVVFYCKSGLRSKKAVELLENEFTNLYNLKNGLADW